MCYFCVPSVVNETPPCHCQVTSPQILWPQGPLPCAVSQGVHRSLSCLPVPCGAFEIKAGCVRAACPGDTGLFITPELFYWCVNRALFLELYRAVENPETPAEAGWAVLARAGLGFCEGAPVRESEKMSKELDTWAGNLACLPDLPGRADDNQWHYR